ncbi:MAG TPA: STAS domain-containing protein, partial [Ktedonobacteraceae bacterium]|nr:STAS domain-containing protein [Ktedonobacteraceae bacterium]
IEFTADSEMTDGTSRFILSGDLNDEAVATLETQLERIVEYQPRRIDFYLAHLRAMSDTAARALAKANARLPIETDMYQWDANEQVERTLRNLGLGSSLHYEHTEKSTSGS